MDYFISLLKVVFAPVTIITKFIKEDDSGILAFLCFVLWFLAAGLTWGLVATTASITFQAITFFISYILTYIFYHKVDGLGKSAGDASIFLFFLIMAVVAGYPLGLAGHAFFLLY